MPLIDKLYNEYSEDDIPELVVKIATDVQNFINKSYDLYAEHYHNVKKHRWEIKQELIAKTAFWGSAKKRYAMHVVMDNGCVVDTIDIKGFDSVRSDFPTLFREILANVIKMILYKKPINEVTEYIIESKNNIKNVDIKDIMCISSVSNIEKYIPTEFIAVKSHGGAIKYKELVNYDMRYKKGAPVHLKSAINYNILKTHLNLNTYSNIENGDKLLWGYLLTNKYNFDTIALKGYDDPPEIVSFVEEYLYREKIFNKMLLNKLNDIYSDLGWGNVIINPNVFKVFKFN